MGEGEESHWLMVDDKDEPHLVRVSMISDMVCSGTRQLRDSRNSLKTNNVRGDSSKKVGSSFKATGRPISSGN